MSSYKSYTPRRAAESTAPFSTDKLRDQSEKLQELFPNWSHEDLQSVLTETAGDVELAVARISEGHAEQWGSVTRKKEKKNPPPSQSASSSSARGDRERPPVDSRGGRGGRGMRGRGGGGRGGSRGPHSTAQHRDAGAPTAGANGTTTHASPASKDWGPDASAAAPNSDWVSESKANGTGTGDARGTKATTSDANEPPGDGWAASTSKETTVTTSTTAGWNGETTVEQATTSAWATDSGTPDAWTPASSSHNGTADHAKSKVPLKTSKIPPGAKLSWAQIARAQEKPKPSSAPIITQSVPPVPPVTEPQPPPAPEEPPHAPDQQGWEEPTTVQPPTWDDEPSSIPTQPSESQASGHDGWITAESVPSNPPVQDNWDTSASIAVLQDTPQDPHWRQAQPEEPASVPSPQIPTPSSTSIAPSTSAPSVAASIAPAPKPPTPSVTAATARPVNTHKTSARYPKSDQAVVIPAFAGSIGVGGEKLGMQFGSLNITGEDNLDGPFKPETEQVVPPSAPEPPQQPQQTQASTQTQPHDTVQSATVPPPHSQTFFQQQQTTPAAPVQPQQIHSPPQTSQSAPQQSVPSGPPFGSHQQAQSLTQQQQQQLAQHHQQQQQHSYAQQQHGIHAHFDGPPASQQQQPQQQHVSGPQNSSYFRQPESPYYHNPTPPQSAAPEHQGAYATTFSPLGVGAGAHTHAQGLGVGQGQAAHLSGFGAGGPGEYGYGEGQRGFYEYTQPGSFSNRLVHDESSKGGLPLSQSNQPTSSLSSATGQPQASSGPQGSSGQPPAGQQSQQQGYPAPMPYYYPPYYPQNSYPTYPNPSYGQAYIPKYPPVYPHQGPVGPGSAPPPGGKGPSGNAPYTASASQNHLYHAQGGFEDPNSGYQHHQTSTNLGSGEYQKQPPHHQQQQPLYGGQATQGLQSFLGIQQAAGGGQGVSGPGAQQRTNPSPETAYKPYGPPGGAADKANVGIGAQSGQQGRGTGVQQSQQQAGGAGSFYPGGRFSAGAGGPQQQGQQQGQGYPQGGDQGQFYPYQPRHQGGYWQ